MNMTTRKTRLCTLDTLDEDLKAAIHAHALQHGLNDLESDIVVCCETLSVRQNKGFLGGIKTTLSAVYVTPKWLVWVDSANLNDVHVGTAQLKHINISQYRTTTGFTLAPDQGLSIIGRYTDKNRIGTAYIVLDSKSDGQKFRHALQEALNKATN